MASTIQIKRGTGSAVPTGLADGELAINLDNNRLYFGSGSAVKNSFRVAELIADTATITQVTSSIVSSSVLFSSGSNIFGDALSDTHTFNGNITASNHIKVIGTSSLPLVTSPDALGTKFGDGAQIFDSFIVYPNSLFIGNITSSANIKCDDINADNFILNYGGQIKIFDSGNNLETAILNVADALVVFGDADSAVTTLAGTDVTIDAGDDITIDSATHKVKVLGHITASGNISASGDIFADDITAIDLITAERIGSNGATAFGNSADDTHTFIGNITASNNISSSGAIVADQFVIDNADNNGVSLNSSTNAQLDITAGAGGALNLVYFKSAEIEVSGDAKIDGSLIHRGDTDTKITFGTDQMDFVAGNVTMIALDETANGNSISLNAPITASGNISSSGKIHATQYEMNEIPILDQSGTTLRFGHNNSHTKIEIGKLSSQTEGIEIFGDITASGNISGSVTSTGSFGRVEASGVIKAEHIESTDDMTVAGDLDVTGEIECDHLNIADVDDGIHFSDTQVLFVDASNNVNLGVAAHLNTIDLELYGYNHTYTIGNALALNAGGHITLDAGGDITLDAAGDQVYFKDNGTTRLTVDTAVGSINMAGHISASGNISASAGSILSVPLRHLDQTVQSTNGSDAQGDFYYAAGSGAGVSTTKGLVYGLATNGNLFAVDKDTESTCIGLVAVAIGDNSLTDGMLLRGMVKLSHDPFPGGDAAVGKAVYIGDSGQLTGSIAGFASDDFIRIVGYEMESGGVIYFNPDNTFIKKA